MGDFLAGAGLFLAVFAAAAALIWEPSPRRSAAMLVALALIPVLILGDQWNSAEISDLRHDLARFAALAVAAVVAAAALTVVFRRRPILLPLAVIVAVPFRIPIHAGGQEANLLIPLYLVIAGGVLAAVWSRWEERNVDAVPSAGGAGGGERDAPTAGGGAGPAPARADSGARAGDGPAATGPAAPRMVLLPRVLAAVIVLYALQSVYSEDFSQALQNAAFFYVPFALAFALLADLRWDRRLLVLSLGVVGAEALLFVLFGLWEYAARHLIWNDQVIRSNDFHRYFRVNSLFWDPNVYGRYLALAITAIVAALLWARSLRLVLWLAGLVALLWLGLTTTFSQSSFAALLVGLATLAALRWSLRWTLAACAGAAIAAATFVLAAGGSLKIDLSTQQTLNKETSGRANLVKEGIALFGDRPLWGYGSGSFSVAYQKHRTGGSGQLSVSHTEPVTVAAEQGLIGLLAYLALLGVAFATLLRGMTGLMPGLRGPPFAEVVAGADQSVSSAGGAGGAAAVRAQGVSTAADATPATGPAAERLGPPATGPAVEGLVLRASRAAIFACFVALVAHTMAYAGFLEDPLTWVLLSIGGSLALAPQVAMQAPEERPGREAIVPFPARSPA
jgi:O-antigen ligase